MSSIPKGGPSHPPGPPPHPPAAEPKPAPTQQHVSPDLVATPPRLAAKAGAQPLPPQGAAGPAAALAAPLAPGAREQVQRGASSRSPDPWNPLDHAWQKSYLPNEDLQKYGLGYFRAPARAGAPPQWVPVALSRVDRGQGNYLLMTKKIGLGGYGTVHLAIKPDGTYCVVKKSRLEEKRDAYNEIIDAQTSVTQPAWFADEARLDRRVEGAETIDAGVVRKRFRKGYEVLPLGLDFLDSWGRLPNKTPWFDVARIVLQQAAESVARLHQEGYLHLDCKPENIILVDGKAKMLDRGLAVPLGADGTVELTSPRGSLGYEAPEVMFEGTCRPSTDTWGLAQIALRSVALPMSPFHPPPAYAWFDRVARRDQAGDTVLGDGGFPVCDEARLANPQDPGADVYDRYMARLATESPDRYRGILSGTLRLQEEWCKDVFDNFEAWHATLWRHDVNGVPRIDLDRLKRVPPTVFDTYFLGIASRDATLVRFILEHMLHPDPLRRLSPADVATFLQQQILRTNALQPHQLARLWTLIGNNNEQRRGLLAVLERALGLVKSGQLIFPPRPAID
jgi:serine/threonine protein kinase